MKRAVFEPLSKAALCLALVLVACDHDGGISPDAGDTGADGDADSDADSDTDSDSDTDTGSDTGIESAMTDCEGGKLDPATGLCWQEPSPPNLMSWAYAFHYCGELVQGGHDDWRVPNIDELISLLRGCVNGAATYDLSPSTCEMMPAGCVATDDCDYMLGCSECPVSSGPGMEGCFMDPAFAVPCGRYWSSSSCVGYGNQAWIVHFDSGHVGRRYGSEVNHGKCVRGGH